MKKQLFIILCIFIIFLGCENKSLDTNTTLTDSNSTYNKTIDTVSEIVKNSTEGKTFEEIGNELMNSETILGIKKGTSTKEVIKLIGLPDEKSTAEEWGSDGQTHQTWKYVNNNFDIEMIGEENSIQIVNSILISSPSNLKTLRNIGIGSSIAEVTAKYANEIDKSQSSENSIVVGSPFGGIIFTFENNKLTRIFIGASAE